MQNSRISPDPAALTRASERGYSRSVIPRSDSQLPQALPRLAPIVKPRMLATSLIAEMLLWK
jgi:hypothetical protein